jgi:hypothetical protein
LKDGDYTDKTWAVDLKWESRGHFQWRRLRDSKLKSGVLLVDGTGWRQGTNERYTLLATPEGYQRELSENWKLWDTALEPFVGQVTLSPLGEGLVEGREAWEYGVSLTPQGTGEEDGARARRRYGPTRLNGSVWIDQKSAVRLLADVQGSWTTSGRLPLHHDMEFHLSRARFGEDQGVLPPYAAHADDAAQ